jgi:hypothetical protein
MNATKSIVAVYDVWLNESAVIAAKIAGYNPIESSLNAAFMFQADEMVASQLLLLTLFVDVEVVMVLRVLTRQG